jgi:gliding motility-associated-like protein
MKKIFFAFIFIFYTSTLFAQLTANGVHKAYSNYPDIDLIYLFNGITNSTEIVYQGYASSIKLYRFDNLTTPIASYSFTNPMTAFASFSPDDATGYLLDVDSSFISIWVLDYQKYFPVFTSLTPENNPEMQCNSLKLDLLANVALMQYKSVKGKTYTMDRVFDFNYYSKEWSNGSWIDKTFNYPINLPNSAIYISNVPLIDTKFSIVGDQFARDLMIKPIPFIESPLYSAVAINCHLQSTSTVRTNDNEADRPANPIPPTVSAPFEVFFQSNANKPLTSNFDWQFFKNNSIMFSRTDQDQRYTFVESGSYKVKLKVSNKYCSCSDSVSIRVTTSDLQVPYVFTPNGDGINDEFRVAYKSLISFKCWIFNRWGQKVYTWTDPSKGWDGMFNGLPATPGAYYYIIEATGADGENLNKKGNINLLRGKKK